VVAPENATDLIPVKARGALVVKAEAPAIREIAAINFIFVFVDYCVIDEN